MLLKAQAIGYIGKDATINQVNGRNVINFSVAHDESYNDKAGKLVEKTTWVACSYWVKDGSKLVGHLSKGMRVQVEGKPNAEVYINGEQKAVASLTLRVTSLLLLGGNGGGNTIAPTPVEPVEPVDDLPF